MFLIPRLKSMASGYRHAISTLGLRVTPQTAQVLDDATSVAFLVGSYDGSGNYGDIAQLDAAIGLLGRLDPELLVLPVVEQQFATTHATGASRLIHRPEHVAYYDGGGDPGGDGLVPVAPGRRFALAISYLYGGGFLNPFWGDRKLGMLAAVEALVSGSRRVIRLASGQQVDAGWIAGLDPAAAQMLRRFELLGARDDVSAAALADLRIGGAPLNTGDDAIGILAEAPALGAPASDAARLEVNVHFAEHAWVTDRPDSAREFDVGLLAELSRLAQRPLRVRPLLAYLDPRVDERSGLERFVASCAANGIEVSEPYTLGPESVGSLVGDLGTAALTISSSYHVALTSLLLAVPAAILRDNDYYAQKAKGLLSDFGLPQGFSPRSSDDPIPAAQAIAPHVIDPEVRGRTRHSLQIAAAAVRQRRLETEDRIYTLLGDASQTGAGGPRHAIVDIRQSPGELSFEARLHGREPQQIWLRSATAVEPYPESALAATLMPAMRSGGALTMDEPISPRILRMQREFQGIQRAWSREWVFDDPPLEQVEVSAPVRPVERRQPTGRVAAFFSGGVDSWATVLENPDITDLIFVRGVDILPLFAHQEGLADRVEAQLREAAEELGLRLHSVETNARELSEPNGPGEPEIRWESYYNSVLAAVALFLGPLFDLVLISTGLAYFNQSKIGASWMVDQLWGNENLEISDASSLLGRVGRVELIAAHPAVQRSLRVCWHNTGGAYNCGRCRKCLVTMAILEALDRLDDCETFPALTPEHLELLAAQEVQEPLHLDLCEEALEATSLSGRVDLEQALERMVARGRERLGRDGGGPLAEAERRAAEAEAKLDEVLGSRSWTLTAPLRHLRRRT
jgi:polysaccharide pyruvyl transferase WcaK-like protein